MVRAVRRLITGIDAEGRSAVVEEADLTYGEAMPGIGIDALFDIDQDPPPARPAGHGDHLDLGVRPGRARWIVVEYQPSMTFPLHHTDTIDFDIVLAGSIELTLDDGVHLLETGDCVVMTGVDHAWRSGPDGCTLSVASFGTPPPG
jgi:quercetin dioxygenase-like cupin family protein